MLGWRFRSRRISMKPLRTRRYGTGEGLRGDSCQRHRPCGSTGSQVTVGRWLRLTLCRGGKLRDLGPALLNQGSSAFG